MISKLFLVYILFNFFVNIGLTDSNFPKCDGQIFNNICCQEDCKKCGKCSGEKINDQFCCESIIMQSNKYCDEYPSPCIIERINNLESENGKTDNYDDKTFFKWLFSFESENILSIVKFSLAIFFCIIIFIFVTYSCCFFGKKFPPVPYDDIVGKYD